MEHAWAAVFATHGDGVPGVGCSDCRCQSHRSYFAIRRQLDRSSGALVAAGEIAPDVVPSSRIQRYLI